jgi:hypothetical protein
MTDDTNTIDQMTQDALNILMRTSPQHARHLEIVLEKSLGDRAFFDLTAAARLIQNRVTASNSVEAVSFRELSDRLLSYASNLSLDS